ncbi:MAG: HRDC domain-containing protein [Bacteroidaceae bacterium]|nr:HRDC domain-containing protein [Bacteroidaceae bacterium]
MTGGEFLTSSNPELELAWQLVEETGVNIFLTGKAGTGKTTFLHQLRTRLPKRMVVLAPTGVAAINASGVTIHSFFQLPLSPFVPDGSFRSSEGGRRYQFSKQKKNILRTLDLLVIDEISMVRADVLDAVDDVLRRFRDSREPFGGVQLLMIGDLQQLAPVVKDEEWKLLREFYETPYFFGSHALRQTHHVTIELKRVYRQSDEAFVALLNKVRTNTLSASDVALLNARVLPRDSLGEGVIQLTTHNRTADALNAERLAELKAKTFSFKASVDGLFPETSFPAEETLVLKCGAQVMFLKNDISGRHLFFNGKLAKVVDISRDKIVVRGLDDDKLISVERMEWTNVRYAIDKQTKEIREEVEGTFVQYPLRLAWAITVHKSQGLTFDRAVLDVNASFAAGQVYVALSRCRSLQGLVLTSPLDSRSIITDQYVSGYVDTELREAEGLPEQMSSLKRDYYGSLLKEIFSFQSLQWRLDKVLRIIDEHLFNVYPKLLARYKESRSCLQTEVLDVSPRFCLQIDALLSSDDKEFLAQRIHDAAVYFGTKLSALLKELLSSTKETVDIDNRKVAEQFEEAFPALEEEYMRKVLLLQYISAQGFDVSAYLKEKARVTLQLEQRPVHGKKAVVIGFNEPKGTKGKTSSRQAKSPAKGEKRERGDVPTQQPSAKSPLAFRFPQEDAGDDILHPELYQTLRRWRGAKALQEHKPAYQIFSNAALISLVNTLPTSSSELLKVRGLGAVKCRQYGKEILEIVLDYIAQDAD